MFRRIHHRGVQQTCIGRGNAGLGCCELCPTAAPEVTSCALGNDQIVVLDCDIRNEDDPQVADPHVSLGYSERCGPGSAERLDGDFAYAILHGKEPILARDSVGLEPTYC